jgi:hypothetical protein
MKKKQNTRRNLAESIQKIYAAGMFVTAGFIVGFDSEELSVAEAMVELIEDAAIPICMVGLLYALPNTQLSRRLTKEGRLHPHPKVFRSGGDQCSEGLNFDTLRPKQEVLLDYKRILETVYDPVAYAGRIRRLVGMLNTNRKGQNPREKIRRAFMVHQVLSNLPEPKAIFERTFAECVAVNPDCARYVVLMIALYHHLGPFSRHVIRQIDEKLAEIAAVSSPARTELPTPALIA